MVYGGKLQVTDDEIRSALKKYRGLQYLAADALGISANSLWKKLEKDPSLREFCDECKERRKDLAEHKLVDKLERGNVDALKYFLSCQAKDRGYGKTLQLSVDPEAGKKFESLMNSLAQESSKIDINNSSKEE